jgi:1,4-dihydroxy-2-naphthoyl-CoA hydrolase
MDLPFDPYVARGFDALMGTTITELAPDHATAEVAVRDDLKQPFGLVHGGVIAALAESLASIATGAQVRENGFSVSGLSNQTSFLRPVLSGTLRATATRKHAGRSTWVWEVEFTDDGGRLCALSRMTIAVRPQREPEPPPVTAH